MTLRHSTPNQKRTSTESSIGSSSKWSRRSEEGRISTAKEDNLTREFKHYVNTNNTSSSNVQPCGNCGKKHVGRSNKLPNHPGKAYVTTVNDHFLKHGIKRMFGEHEKDTSDDRSRRDWYKEQ
jgi:hypothetical protein